MTVVNPKSISGINSITMASGSDNLLTIHANDTSEKVRVNSSGDVIVGSGVTLSPDGDIFATGITTISENLKVGTGITFSPDGDVFATGVCTATSFSGDGSNLTGIDADKISEGNTEAEVVDTGSDGHFKVTTEGTERIRVGPSGQIGIAGANYGTSGQVLQSQGSSSAVQWATPSLWTHGTKTDISGSDGYTFTGVPDGASHIRYNLSYCSASAAQQFNLRLEKSTTGGSKSIISSGYQSYSSFTHGGGYGGGGKTTSVELWYTMTNASNSMFGTVDIYRLGSNGTGYLINHVGFVNYNGTMYATTQANGYIFLGTDSTYFISGARFYLNGNTIDGGYASQSYQTP